MAVSSARGSSSSETLAGCEKVCEQKVCTEGVNRRGGFRNGDALLRRGGRACNEVHGGVQGGAHGGVHGGAHGAWEARLCSRKSKAPTASATR